MPAADRLLEIEQASADLIIGIAPLDLDGETLRIILYLSDGTNLRVTERWNRGKLLRYSYYWLTANNDLIVGWDNVAHHRQVASYPHHKHVGQQDKVEASSETTLTAVLEFMRKKRAAGTA